MTTVKEKAEARRAKLEAERVAMEADRTIADALAQESAVSDWTEARALDLAAVHLPRLYARGHIKEADAFAARLGARMDPPVNGAEMWDAVKPPPPPPPEPPPLDRHGRIRGACTKVEYRTAKSRRDRAAVLATRGAS